MPGSSSVPPMARLDEFLPVYDIVERHQRHVPAAPEDAAVAAALAAPCRARRARAHALPPPRPARRRDGVRRDPRPRVLELVHEPDCVVVGAAGRPWTPRGGGLVPFDKARRRPGPDAARGLGDARRQPARCSTPRRASPRWTQAPAAPFAGTGSSSARSPASSAPAGSRPPSGRCVDGGRARLPVGASLRRHERRPADRPQPSLRRRARDAVHGRRPRSSSGSSPRPPRRPSRGVHAAPRGPSCSPGSSLPARRRSSSRSRSSRPARRARRSCSARLRSSP